MKWLHHSRRKRGRRRGTSICFEMVLVGVVEFVKGRGMNTYTVVNMKRAVGHRHMAITLSLDVRHLQVVAACSFC